MLSNSILAIDTSNLQEALTLGKKVQDKVFTVKLGLEFFNAHGKVGIHEFNKLGYMNIMLDLKLYDIPKTVYKAIKSLDGVYFSYITVHGQGGKEMIKAAKQAASEIISNPQIMMVTVLTSLNYDNITERVRSLSLIAQAQKVNIICSGLEAKMVRDVLGSDLLIFTPGIRHESQDKECHQRVCTAEYSLENGANKVIIGKNYYITKMLSEIIDLYNTHGNKNYYGEKVSKTEHMIQCAVTAEMAGEQDHLVLACLLHDIGHFLGKDDTNGYGVADHGMVGYRYLKSMGIDEKVCHLVRKHTDAKRYLVTIDDTKYRQLSEASKRTLDYQGGKMTEEELLRMERDPRLSDILKVRVYDDLSKKENVKLPKIEAFIPLINKFLIV